MTDKPDHSQQVKLFTALSDLTRLRVVELLAPHEEMSTSLVAEKLDISLSLACHHVKILAEAGLIEKRKEGQTTYILLNRSLLRQSLEGLNQLLDQPS